MHQDNYSRATLERASKDKQLGNIKPDRRKTKTKRKKIGGKTTVHRFQVTTQMKLHTRKLGYGYEKETSTEKLNLF